VLRLSIVCHLRELRAGRRILDLEAITGIRAGTLSQLETGQRLPKPDHIAALERAYGPRRDWYSVEMTTEATS
jgi:hypothetical protein